jgi:hypothetical protein
MNLLAPLLHEREHQRRCFLCHPAREVDVPDLCVWHFYLVEFRLWRFLRRTRQFGKGRWKP